MSYKAKVWHTGDAFTPTDATEMSQAIEDNEVIVNPELAGDEPAAKSIQVGKDKFKLSGEDINYLEIIPTLNYEEIPTKYLLTDYTKIHLNVAQWANDHYPYILDALSDITILPEVQELQEIAYIDIVQFDVHNQGVNGLRYKLSLELHVSYPVIEENESEESSGSSGQSGPTVDYMFVAIRKEIDTDVWETIDVTTYPVSGLNSCAFPTTCYTNILEQDDAFIYFYNKDIYNVTSSEYLYYTVDEVYNSLFGVYSAIEPNTVYQNTSSQDKKILSNLKIGQSVYYNPTYPSVITNDVWNSLQIFNHLNMDRFLELLKKFDYDAVVNRDCPDFDFGGFNMPTNHYSYGGDTQFGGGYEHFIEIRCNTLPSCTARVFGDNTSPSQYISGGTYVDFTLEKLLYRLNMGFGMETVYPYGKENETVFIYPYVRLNGNMYWLSWEDLNYIFSGN